MSAPGTQSPPSADVATPAFRAVAVVGLGLIGGSIALALRQAWPSVRITGIDTATVLESATQRHAIDSGSDDLSALSGADLVVLAAPVAQNVRVVAALPEYLTGPAIITDAGSTKRDIVRAAAVLPPHLTFIGGHPLGGAAFGGFEHARPDLFRGRPWIFTPDAAAPQAAVDKVRALATAVGSAPHLMSAEEHDRVLAFLSHLPQLAVSALMAVVGDAVGAEAFALAGRGLVDTTRLASSPSAIWRDIAAANADEIGPALDLLIAALQSVRADLHDGRALGDIFAAAARWREQLTSRSTI